MSDPMNNVVHVDFRPKPHLRITAFSTPTEALPRLPTGQLIRCVRALDEMCRKLGRDVPAYENDYVTALFIGFMGIEVALLKEIKGRELSAWHRRQLRQQFRGSQLLVAREAAGLCKSGAVA